MRFKQRLFHLHSESGVTEEERFLNDLSYEASPGNGLDAVEKSGFYMFDGVNNFDVPAAAPVFWMGVDGTIACALVGTGQILGEFTTGVPAEYLGVAASSARSLRSEIMIDYQMLTQGGIAQGEQNPMIVGFDPGVGVAPVYTFVIDTLMPPDTSVMSEGTAGLGPVGTAFTSILDGQWNRIKISAQQIAIGQKNLVVTWFDRAKGVGVVPIVWYINSGAGIMRIINLKTSSSVIPYGTFA
jgi:hypothetical protein